MKASPPCPPSSRLLNLVKLGMQHENQNNTSTNLQNDDDQLNESSSKKLNFQNDIEIDVIGKVFFF
jgi:hypothetical protein